MAGEKIWVQCSLCGQPKQIHPYKLKESRTGKYFCSAGCHDEYRKGKEGRKASHDEIEQRRIRMRKYWEDSNWKRILRKKIKKAMANPEVAEKVRQANSRKRSPRSFESKKKQSDALVGKMPQNLEDYISSSSVRSIAGRIDFGSGRSHHMRSTWERNVARYFEYLRRKDEIQDWEYEPQRFFFEGVAFGNRTYLPDFRITEKSGYQYYVEVKGWMDKASKVKLKRMQKCFPEIEIQIIDKERYIEISRIAPIISDWEYEQVSRRASRLL